MPKLDIDIVTAERIVYSETQVDEIIAPGVEGEFAVLPRHAAFMTMLVPGVLVIKKGGGGPPAPPAPRGGGGGSPPAHGRPPAVAWLLTPRGFLKAAGLRPGTQT